MRKILKKFAAALTSIYALGMANLAYAQGSITSNSAIISKPAGEGILPGSGATGDSIESSIVFSKIIPFLISWAINLAIGLTVLMFIYGGFLYLTAYGEAEKREKATRTLMYASAGLVLALTAYGIVTIITRIQFT